MKIQLDRLNEDFHFALTNERGHIVHIDSPSSFGGHDLAPSPMEYLLMAVAGCSSVDIIHILKKQRQTVTDFRLEIEGFREQEADAKPFKHMLVHVYLEGTIKPAKALRAAQLSFEKYCSVSITLGDNVAIDYVVFVNGEKA